MGPVPFLAQFVFTKLWFASFRRLAGFFWLAGCILCAFLVPVSGTILVPVFGTSLPPNIRLLFNFRFLVPIFGTCFGTQNWDQKPYSFLSRTPVTFQPNFEQSVHLTKHGNQIGTRFGYLGPSQTMRYISLSTLFGVSFGAQSWDPKLVVLRPQVLASSRRSKSHTTPARLHVILGDPLHSKPFFRGGLVLGRVRKPDLFFVSINNRKRSDLRTPPQMCVFLHENHQKWIPRCSQRCTQAFKTILGFSWCA